MFIDACITSSKICRAISLEQGHCFIIGNSGKGRNTLSRLSIFLSSQKMYEIGMNQNYSMRIWQDDLKKIFSHCGIDKL